MHTQSLKKLLDTLVELKATMHDVANTSANGQLDEAIALVQQCIEKGNADTATKNRILFVIGAVIDKLPSIAALLKLFSD